MVLAHLEPEQELFEVDAIGDDGDDDLCHHYLPNFKQLCSGLVWSQQSSEIFFKKSQILAIFLRPGEIDPYVVKRPFVASFK